MEEVHKSSAVAFDIFIVLLYTVYFIVSSSTIDKKLEITKKNSKIDSKLTKNSKIDSKFSRFLSISSSYSRFFVNFEFYFEFYVNFEFFVNGR